jgi:hypothetical protein
MRAVSAVRLLAGAMVSASPVSTHQQTKDEGSDESANPSSCVEP